jgi:hypothetical protein
MINALERILNTPLERRKLQGFDYMVPAAPDTKNIPSPGQSRRHILPTEVTRPKRHFAW